MKKRKRVYKNKKIEFDRQLKKSLPYKLLLFFILLLISLLLVLIAYELITSISKPQKEKLEGELGTLCVFCSDNLVRLTVLNHTISSDNSTIQVNINWTSGNISSLDFSAIRVYFINGSGYNFTLGVLPPGINFGENKTYEFGLPPFSPVNFGDVVEVRAYAEIEIHLIQNSSIPLIQFYKDSSKNNLIHLNNYFKALTEINYSFIESPNNENISIVINNITKNVSISVLDIAWHGTQVFNLTASTADGDSLTTNFSIIVINENKPSLNRGPEFLEDVCDHITWNKNTSHTLNMTSCWTDDDNDSLTYGYRNRTGNNLTISQSGNSLTLTPALNWNGTGRFSIWANDSKEMVIEEIYFVVRGDNYSTTPPVIINGTNNSGIIILAPNPSGEIWTLFEGTNQTFSIGNLDYDRIEWYLNDQLRKENSLFYAPGNLSKGNYTIRVVVKKGWESASKTWNLIIQEEREIEETPLFDFGQIMFYTIIVVIFIIILLLIWLFIAEKQKQNKKMDGFGFGISIKPETKPPNQFKQSVALNIPR